MSTDLIETRIQDSIKIKQNILNDPVMVQAISDIAEVITEVLNNNGKLLLCGNGGSASDALHFAGEIVGRFQKERRALPAVVLNSDVATMTAIANDYGYEEVFSRQVDGHMNSSDVFIGISTSGNSGNVVKAAIRAKEIGGKCLALVGGNGGKMKEIADYTLSVPCSVTARIQECHIMIIHILCELIEEKVFLS